MNLEKAKAINGLVYPIELEWLANQAAKRLFIIELGSYTGGSTRAICDNTKGEVWAVDQWVDYEKYPILYPGATEILETFNTNLADHLESGKLHQLCMTSDRAYEEYFNKVNFNFPCFDMVFIDANHEYEYVKRDIQNYRKLLRIGGLLCGHNTDFKGVVRAVEEELGTDVERLSLLWWKIL